MTRSSRQHEKRTGAPTLPGVEVITYAQRQAARSISAVERTPVGRRIINVLRNMIWVVPLTVLVWLYAEREQIAPQQGLSIPITVVSERADRVVEVVRPEDGTVTIDIKGTRARIEQARQELTAKQGIQLVLPASAPVGPQVPMPAMEAIATHRVFADRGIVVTSVSPATLTLNVDELREGMEFRPQVSREVAALLESPPIFDPPVARVSGPRSVLMNREDPAEVIAELTEQMLPKVPGEHVIGGITLRLKNPDPRVRITPSTVSATVHIKASTTRYVLTSVPVFTMGPQAVLDKYHVDFGSKGPFINNVTVVGPEDQINRIKSNEFIPRAVLEIRSEDARSPLPRAPFMYILPDGVEVIEEDLSRTITFELKERLRGE